MYTNKTSLMDVITISGLITVSSIVGYKIFLGNK